MESLWTENSSANTEVDKIDAESIQILLQILSIKFRPPTSPGNSLPY